MSALYLLRGFAIFGLFIVAPIWYAGVLTERRCLSIFAQLARHGDRRADEGQEPRADDVPR
jgi:hypothetical protein